jgi:hypothetical protein
MATARQVKSERGLGDINLPAISRREKILRVAVQERARVKRPSPGCNGNGYLSNNAPCSIASGRYRFGRDKGSGNGAAREEWMPQ